MSSAWAMAAALTFAASVHCLGMCGGFMLSLSSPALSSRLRRLGDPLLLQLGKAASYAFLGALAGTFGAAFLASPLWSGAARTLAVVAGLALVLAGLSLLGLRARAGGDWLSARVAQLGAQWLAPLLSQRPAGASLVIGMAMGFLPCPLVYAGLAAAVATGSAAGGAATLAGVALGTVPALTLVALFGSALPAGARHALARGAGVLLLAVGLVTAWRGLATHQHHGHAGHAAPAAGATEQPAAQGDHCAPTGPAQATPAPDHAHH